MGILLIYDIMGRDHLHDLPDRRGGGKKKKRRPVTMQPMLCKHACVRPFIHALPQNQGQRRVKEKGNNALQIIERPESEQSKAKQRRKERRKSKLATSRERMRKPRHPLVKQREYGRAGARNMLAYT